MHLYSNLFKITSFIFLFMMFSPQIQAVELIADGCLVFNSSEALPIAEQYQFNSSEQNRNYNYQIQKAIESSTCRSLGSANQVLEYIKIGIMPVSMAFALPAARSALFASATTVASLLTGTPVIASITVITAAGLGTAYLVLNITMHECRRMEKEIIKKEIFDELEYKYGISPKKTRSVPVRIYDGII